MKPVYPTIYTRALENLARLASWSQAIAFDLGKISNDAEKLLQNLITPFASYMICNSLILVVRCSCDVLVIYLCQSAAGLTWWNVGPDAKRFQRLSRSEDRYIIVIDWSAGRMAWQRGVVESEVVEMISSTIKTKRRSNESCRTVGERLQSPMISLA